MLARTEAAELISVETLAAREALRTGVRALARAKVRDLTIEARHVGEDLWLLFSREDTRGGLALRAALGSPEGQCEVLKGDALIEIACRVPFGRWKIRLAAHPGGFEDFHCTVALTPTRAIHLPYLPRDLVAFGATGDPLRTHGVVEARQRRLNTGLCYFDAIKPDLGKVLYVQDLTHLNAYFEATGTKPEGAVGGEWPVLGYLPPTKPGDPRSRLPGKRETIVSSAHLIFRRHAKREESHSAWQFLDMLGAAYARLERPTPGYRDWPARTRRTLRDLERSPKVRDRHGKHVYFHPYTASEYPDSMVQLSLLAAIREWSRWTGRRHPLEREIRNGLVGFYDPRLKTLRRYLPDVGKDKDKDAVDSWYLYHPLKNLAELARDGDEKARDLFDRSVDYAIKAAHHFKYKWPIQFKIDSFEVITSKTADGNGQSDCGGMYAWVMLEAFALTGEPRFIDEAKAALAAAEGMRFELNYQANLTAWGAAACIRLWRITDDRRYLEQSYVFLASFFHNCQMWRSRIGHARHYSNFFAATCLHDAPYMALYECFDSYAAFERYLDFDGPDLIASAKMLIIEYCRYALDRTWSYYPDALPKAALATEQRNGHIDRKLNLPLEDLYPDGQPAGQVGQEIYGGGAAMVFATRAFHPIDDAPFLLHCDHFVRSRVRIERRALAFSLDGMAGECAALHLLKRGRRALPEFRLLGRDGAEIRPVEMGSGRVVYAPPANGPLILSWKSEAN